MSKFSMSDATGRGRAMSPFPKPTMTRTVLLYLAAAVAEIAGCYGFWLWLRRGASPWSAVAGVGALVVFAWLLTLVDSPAAGRAFAAYGGVYVALSLVWLARVEGVRLTGTDIVGAGICLAGAALILAGPRLT